MKKIVGIVNTATTDRYVSWVDVNEESLCVTAIWVDFMHGDDTVVYFGSKHLIGYQASLERKDGWLFIPTAALNNIKDYPLVNIADLKVNFNDIKLAESVKFGKVTLKLGEEICIQYYGDKIAQKTVLAIKQGNIHQLHRDVNDKDEDFKKTFMLTDEKQRQSIDAAKTERDKEIEDANIVIKAAGISFQAAISDIAKQNPHN